MVTKMSIKKYSILSGVFLGLCDVFLIQGCGLEVELKIRRSWFELQTSDCLSETHNLFQWVIDMFCSSSMDIHHYH